MSWRHNQHNVYLPTASRHVVVVPRAIRRATTAIDSAWAIWTGRPGNCPLEDMTEVLDTNIPFMNVNTSVGDNVCEVGRAQRCCKLLILGSMAVCACWPTQQQPRIGFPGTPEKPNTVSWLEPFLLVPLLLPAGAPGSRTHKSCGESRVQKDKQTRWRHAQSV